MAKKRLNLTIDEEVYNAAKNSLNNFSQCFERYLSSIVENGENIVIIKEKLAIEERNLYKTMNNIVILQSELKNALGRDGDIKNLVWTEFKIELQKRRFDREYEFMDENIVSKAEEILGYPRDILIQIESFVRYNYRNFNCAVDKINDWDNVELEWRSYNDKLLQS